MNVLPPPTLEEIGPHTIEWHHDATGGRYALVIRFHGGFMVGRKVAPGDWAVWELELYGPGMRLETGRLPRAEAAIVRLNATERMLRDDGRDFLVYVLRRAMEDYRRTVGPV